MREAGWVGAGPLDLSPWWVVVPTRQSGRRLREALAVAAAAQDQAAFPPLVLVPEALPGALAALPRLATRQEAIFAWVRVLQQVELAEVRAVIPHDPPRRDFAWAWALAGRLQRVAGTLAEAGLRFADVAALEEFPEQERWRQLATLESAVDAVLASQGRQLRAAAERAGLAGTEVPAGCARILLIGVPDPLPVAIAYLERRLGVVPIEVLVWGDGLGAFDRWGRPQAESWAQRPLGVPSFGEQVRLTAHPVDQARRLAAIAMAHPAPDEWLAVAIADPEIIGPAELELADVGVPTFKPEGDSWQRSALFGLVSALADLATDAAVATVGAVLRHPDVLNYLAATAQPTAAADPIGPDPADFSPAELLRRWDALRLEFLPADLAQARRQAGTRPQLDRALAQIGVWRERLRREPFTDGALGVVGEIYGVAPIEAGSPLAEAARRWVDTVESVEAARPLGPALSVADAWRLTVATFGEGGRFGPKPAGAVELGGWLEVLWADAPRLLVLGANDGVLPEAVVGDAFLPEGLRERLGLKTNAERLARDAYLLAASCALRADGRDVEVLVGKTSAAGEPLRPSRLLLAGPDTDLPARVRHLFRPLEARQANLPWRRAWALAPRLEAPPAAVSVTALRDWLECPFRFYLRRVLRMEALDLAKGELDARDFGTLLHAALQAMGEDSVLRESTDEVVLREGLLAVFEREAESKFGGALSLPLIIQLESARQRLRRAAALQAQVRAEGWRIVRVETPFSLPLGRLQVRGKIDRIDRHDDGRVRVIDYKTSDRPVAPLAAHVDTVRAEDLSRPDWLRLEIDGRAKRWVDLQLPLYRRALAAEFGSELTCAYFNLPKAIGESGVVDWPEGRPELQAAAERCAAGVAAAISAGEFWPPVEASPGRDDPWALVFQQGVAASVRSDWCATGEGGT